MVEINIQLLVRTLHCINIADVNKTLYLTQ